MLQRNFYDLFREVRKEGNYPKGYVESIGDVVMKELHDSLVNLESSQVRVPDFGTFKIKDREFMKTYKEAWKNICLYGGKKIRKKYLHNGELEKLDTIKQQLLLKKTKQNDARIRKSTVTE